MAELNSMVLQASPNEWAYDPSVDIHVKWLEELQLFELVLNMTGLHLYKALIGRGCYTKPDERPLSVTDTEG